MNDALHYSLLESDIHYFTWLKNDQSATKRYITLFGQIINQTRPTANNQHIIHRFILDFRYTSLAPLENMVSDVVDMRQQNLISSEHYTCLFAYLSDDEDFEAKINAVAPLVPKSHQRRFFNGDEIQEAIDWLLQEK